MKKLCQFFSTIISSYQVPAMIFIISCMLQSIVLDHTRHRKSYVTYLDKK